MKLRDILLVALLGVMGSLVFAIKQSQKSLETDSAIIPVPSVKPAPPKIAGLPELRLDLSTPETAGSYGRLSLDKFLAQGEAEITIRDTAPKSSAATTPLRSSEPSQQPIGQTLQPRMGSNLLLRDDDLGFDKAEALSLPYVPVQEKDLFIDRVTQMAEASPLQPDSRGCGTLNHNIKSGAKHSKVRSVGLERQLTERTSIGVEYVYKDGCYKKAIAALPLGNMPSDDGVNLRVNMRF
jgi:hypothetical protein